MEFRRVLKQLRMRLGLTQEGLAQASGVGVRTIRDLEAGRIRAPRVGTIRLLADGLGLEGAERAAFCSAASGVVALPSDTPEGATRSPAAGDVAPVPAQLPADPPGFVGRARELRLLDDLLDAAERGIRFPTVAVSGTAGIGKTALALHWAHRAASRFPDGQLWVDLRGFDPAGGAVDAHAALRGFLEALGTPGQGMPVTQEAREGLYRTRLANRRVLIVLDNARDAAQVRPLLPGGAGCLVLVTSRNVLTGLTVANGAVPLTLDLLPAAEARALLVGRLGTRRVEDEAEAVERVIQLCARLPLALAIAAARVAGAPGTSLALVADEVQQAHGGLDALAAGDPATDLRAVLNSSYESLAPPAARLLRLLGMHPGPDVGLGAVAALLGAGPAEAVRHLRDLTTWHLATRTDDGRWWMHDLLRCFARERAEVEEPPEVRRAALERVLAHYVALGCHAARLLEPHRDARFEPDPDHAGGEPPFTDYDGAMAWFHREREVLLDAVRAAALAGLDRAAWQLAWTLVDYLDRIGAWHDLIAVHVAARAAARRADDRAGEADSLRGMGLGQARLSLHAESEATYREALTLYCDAGDVRMQARTRLNLSYICGQQGLHAEALAHSEAALSAYRQVEDRAGQATALNTVGWYSAQLGDHERARVSCQEALVHLEAIGDRRGVADTWDSLGFVNARLERFEEAASSFESALAIYRGLGDRYNEADTLTRFGDVQETAGRIGAARRLWAEGLERLDELGLTTEVEDVRSRLERTSAGVPGVSR